jgi:hypothetical protein
MAACLSNVEIRLACDAGLAENLFHLKMEGQMKTRMGLTSSVVISLALSSVSQTRRAHVIEPGQFHGYEVSARSGQRWLGLFVNGRGSALHYSTIKVQRVFDEITDYGTKQKTGKRVSVNSRSQPLLLVSQTTALTPGPVMTVFNMKEDDFSHGLEKFPATFKLGRRSYVLKVVAPGKNPEPCRFTSFPKNAKLVLISGRSQQVLYTLDVCGNDPNWYLVWAGDLDRDGKLDLYVNVTQHYDFSDRKLFLSSPARRGQLVREVGSFETGGC